MNRTSLMDLISALVDEGKPAIVWLYWDDISRTPQLFDALHGYMQEHLPDRQEFARMTREETIAFGKSIGVEERVVWPYDPSQQYRNAYWQSETNIPKVTWYRTKWDDSTIGCENIFLSVNVECLEA